MTVLRSIPAPAEALLGSSALAHVVTRNRDGSPQVSVVWCGVRGDQVFFCAEGSTAKVRNIRREPAVVLSIEDEARNLTGTQQHLLVYGTARVLDGPADKELCDELCRTYVGRADHHAQPQPVVHRGHRDDRGRPHRRQRPLVVRRLIRPPGVGPAEAGPTVGACPRAASSTATNCRSISTFTTSPSMALPSRPDVEAEVLAADLAGRLEAGVQASRRRGRPRPRRTRRRTTPGA